MRIIHFPILNLQNNSVSILLAILFAWKIADTGQWLACRWQACLITQGEGRRLAWMWSVIISRRSLCGCLVSGAIIFMWSGNHVSDCYVAKCKGLILVMATMVIGSTEKLNVWERASSHVFIKERQNIYQNIRAMIGGIRLSYGKVRGERIVKAFGEKVSQAAIATPIKNLGEKQPGERLPERFNELRGQHTPKKKKISTPRKSSS